MITYFSIAVFCTVLFLVQFILSFVTSDFDVDIDSDGEFDLKGSDFLSFKGLLHFGIGFCWSMYLQGPDENKLKALIISGLIGISFVVLIWLVYWGAIKLKHEVIEESGEALVGRTVMIYLKLSGYTYKGYVEKNAGYREIIVVSESGKVDYTANDILTITKFENGIYYIL